MKIATTLDGKIALGAQGNYQSQWITSAHSRRVGHLLRARADAVVTGAGTVKHDNPILTCRIEGLGAYQPKRVILASRTDKIPADKKIFQGKDILLVYNNPDFHGHYQKIADRNSQIALYFQPETAHNGRIDLSLFLQKMAEMNIASLMLEAGSVLSTAFFQAGWVDRLYLFENLSFIGNDALPALADLRYENLSDRIPFKIVAQDCFGNDRFTVLDRCDFLNKVM